MNRTRFDLETLMNDVDWHIVRTVLDKDGDPVPVERVAELCGVRLRHTRCADASAYGLGTCHCRSHDPDTFEEF